MALSEFFASRVDAHREPERAVLPRVPTAQDLLAALDGVEAMVARGVVPAPVASRVSRVSRTVRDTIPRLSNLGAGSPQAYNVMATATTCPRPSVVTYACRASGRTVAPWTAARPR